MAKRRIYEFLQLTSKLPYPPTVKAQLSTAHSNLIEQLIKQFDGTRKSKEHIIHVVNCITYMYMSGDSLPTTWNIKDPLHTYTECADDDLESNIGECFLHQKDVDWVDVKITFNSDSNSVNSVNSVKDEDKPVTHIDEPVKEVPKSEPVTISATGFTQSSIVHTHKSDLYIQPPVVPRFNTSEAFASGVVDGTPFVVYPSYPEIPTKQNEISATTDVNRMTDSELLNLFPTEFIRTRAECMYEEHPGIKCDSQLGLILPIKGYTEKQLRDNIIKYPHIFKLMKCVEGSFESFYSTIEIDGQLHKISEVWENLPESKSIPYTKEFVKEYVVRRYLLERDIKHIDHKYKIFGSLDPFLTLFAPADFYVFAGYKKPVELAKSCVIARVNYKQSRNPVLRRLADV